MSDARLRELERRWQETGDAADEARHLRERVRAGDLGPAGLRLAASLGHAAALEACGEPVARADDDLRGWARSDLPAAGGVAVGRAALALARHAWARTTRPIPGEELVDEMLVAVRAWCLCPCAGHARAAADLASPAAFAWAQQGGALQGPDGEHLLRAAQLCGAIGSAAGEPSSLADAAVLPIVGHLRRRTPGDELREVGEALARELVPWALGRADPLAEEVARSRARWRALEARWRASGSPGEGAELLRERVRAGDLAPARLALAAHLGLAAARDALSRPLDLPPGQLPWRRALWGWGREACIRVALAAADLAVAAAGPPARDDEGAARAFEAVSAGLARAGRWLEDPTEERRSRAAEEAFALRALAATGGGPRAPATVAALQTAREALRWTTARAGPPPPVVAAGPPDDVALGALVEELGRDPDSLGPADLDRSGLDRAAYSAVFHAIEQASRTLAALDGPGAGSPFERVRAGVAARVVPWALGLA